MLIYVFNIYKRSKHILIRTLLYKYMPLTDILYDFVKWPIIIIYYQISEKILCHSILYIIINIVRQIVNWKLKHCKIYHSNFYTLSIILQGTNSSIACSVSLYRRIHDISITERSTDRYNCMLCSFICKFTSQFLQNSLIMK